MKDQIVEFLNERNLINKLQSGFRENHSTTTALLNISDDIKRNIDKQRGTILVLLDFSSAFISVNHNILLEKLCNQFKFSSPSIDLVDSYLSNRSQAVFVNDEISDFLEVNLGVPQGSVLGPLLFSLFINDITNCIQNSKSHVFADDVQVYISTLLNNIQNSTNLINADLESISIWSQHNLIKLNPVKSQAIFI